MHIAIIMDGNGRWATQRGLPRSAGHAEGAKAVRTTVEAAARAGIDALTLYAFSSANWARPPGEIAALMHLFGQYLFTETRRCIEQSIRLNVIGRRDRLSDNLLRSIEQSERASSAGTGMLLRIAMDYSAQHSIAQAASLLARGSDGGGQPVSGGDNGTGGREGPAAGGIETFQRLLDQVDHCRQPAGPVDLLIRTGSERRLSDFLLWESAFAELHFSDCLWPEFNDWHFQRALDDFAGRERRFGALGAKRR